jgi:hypothetical protein
MAGFESTGEDLLLLDGSEVDPLVGELNGNFLFVTDWALW